MSPGFFWSRAKYSFVFQVKGLVLTFLQPKYFLSCLLLCYLLNASARRYAAMCVCVCVCARVCVCVCVIPRSQGSLVFAFLFK